jgi:hypothetical protein
MSVFRRYHAELLTVSGGRWRVEQIIGCRHSLYTAELVVRGGPDMKIRKSGAWRGATTALWPYA